MKVSYYFSQISRRFLVVIVVDVIMLLGAFSVFGFGPEYRVFGIFFYMGLILLAGVTIREMNDFLLGVEGEEAVKKELRKLPKEYSTYFNFVHGIKGNIDAIVIGPAGIWVIEVKNYKYIQFPIDKELKQAYAEKKHLENFIQESTGLSLPVNPVLVFANPHTKVRMGLKPVEGVQVVGITWLIRLLQEHPISTISSEHRKEVEEAVKKYAN